MAETETREFYQTRTWRAWALSWFPVHAGAMIAYEMVHNTHVAVFAFARLIIFIYALYVFFPNRWRRPVISIYGDVLETRTYGVDFTRRGRIHSIVRRSRDRYEILLKNSLPVPVDLKGLSREDREIIKEFFSARFGEFLTD